MSDAAEKTADAKPGNGKKFLIIGLAVALIAGGGGAAWWFLGRGEPDTAAAEAEAEAKRLAARQFVTLDPFVVNLADRQSERYAQVGVVLEVEGKDANQKLTSKMPAVRNEILLLISSKQAADLVTREGKEALAAEIAIAAARPLGWTPHEEPEPEPEPPPKAKGEKGEKGEKARAAAKAKRPPPPPPPPNPVAQVHFASFIVQ